MIDMMTSPADARLDVSVIIPALNEEDHIGTQLDALSRSDFSGRWEVVVADNGSTDRTVDIVQSWEHRLPGLRCVDASDRRGCGAAKNIGAEQASGRVLAFCDADDVVAPGWLSALCAAAESSEVVGGASRIFTETPPGEEVESGFQRQPQSLFGFLPFADGCNFAIRSESFWSLGGFDEEITHAENVDLSWRAQIAGMELRFAEAAHVHKRERTGWRALARQYYRYGRSDVLIYDRFRSHGLSAEPPAAILRRYLGLVARTPLALVGVRRRSWVVTASKASGRLVGSVSSRRVCL